MQLDDISAGILHYICARDEVAIAETDLAAGREPEVSLGWFFTKIIPLDIKYFRERNPARSHARVFGIVDGVHLLDQIVGIVVDDYAQRSQHSHDARRLFVQVFAN